MKKIENQRAIALLSIAAGLIYLVSIISSVVNSHKAGLENVSTYWENKLFNDKKNSTGVPPSYKKVSLRNKEHYFFADSVLNIRDKQYIPINFSQVDVVAIEEQPKPIFSLLVYLAQVIFMIFLIPAILYIPVLFYKLIFSVYKGDIFNSDNVTRLNILGCIFTISYFIALCLGYLLYFEDKATVTLENFEVPAPNILGSFHFLLFGVIILLIAQVMKKALLMKEEQDLTI